MKQSRPLRYLPKANGRALRGETPDGTLAAASPLSPMGRLRLAPLRHAEARDATLVTATPPLDKGHIICTLATLSDHFEALDPRTMTECAKCYIFSEGRAF